MILQSILQPTQVNQHETAWLPKYRNIGESAMLKLDPFRMKENVEHVLSSPDRPPMMNFARIGIPDIPEFE